MNPELKLLGISQKTYDFVKFCENSLGNIYEGIEANEAYTQARVLKAFQDNCIALRHFAPTSGYGYDDIGREALGAVFACALEAEDALVRPQISSGTQAIFTALSGLLEPGDVMLSLTGKPYDTLEKAIGISGDEYCSLKRMGVIYRQVDLTADGHIDIDAAKAAITGSEKVIYFQRSRGYSWRNALTPEEMAPVFDMAKKLAPNAFVVVDNCYGEFTRPHEPAYYGADVMIGSLIKNIGSGIAPTGGYIAGTHRDAVDSARNGQGSGLLLRQLRTVLPGYIPVAPRDGTGAEKRRAIRQGVRERRHDKHAKERCSAFRYSPVSAL